MPTNPEELQVLQSIPGVAKLFSGVPPSIASRPSSDNVSANQNHVHVPSSIRALIHDPELDRYQVPSDPKVLHDAVGDVFQYVLRQCGITRKTHLSEIPENVFNAGFRFVNWPASLAYPNGEDNLTSMGSVPQTELLKQFAIKDGRWRFGVVNRVHDGANIEPFISKVCLKDSGQPVEWSSLFSERAYQLRADSFIPPEDCKCNLCIDRTEPRQYGLRFVRILHEGNKKKATVLKSSLDHPNPAVKSGNGDDPHLAPNSPRVLLQTQSNKHPKVQIPPLPQVKEVPEDAGPSRSGPKMRSHIKKSQDENDFDPSVYRATGRRHLSAPRRLAQQVKGATIGSPLAPPKGGSPSSQARLKPEDLSSAYLQSPGKMLNTLDPSSSLSIGHPVAAVEEGRWFSPTPWLSEAKLTDPPSWLGSEAVHQFASNSISKDQQAEGNGNKDDSTDSQVESEDEAMDTGDHEDEDAEGGT